MRAVFQSNDPVRLSFVMALLRDGGVEPLLFDAHMSAVEGSIGAIMRRIMVVEDEEMQALRVLREADQLG